MSPIPARVLIVEGVAGIENERLSGFLGGAIGIAVVGIAGTGIYFWVRTPKSGDIK